jgi:two-component system, LytTR family, response regulator
MLNCIIIDDERHAIKVMEAHIAETPSLNLLRSFKSPVEAMAWLTTNQTDLVFLDINMPKITGIEFAKALKGKAMVILCTAYPEYGAESYEHAVLDYLLKPVEYVRFFQAVEKAIVTSEKIKAKEPAAEFNSIMVHLSGKLTRIAFDDVIYLSGDRNYTDFHLAKQTHHVHILLKDVIKKLPPRLFVRVHHSYIVAINHIKHLNNNSITLSNIEKAVPISDTYRQGLLAAIKAND